MDIVRDTPFEIGHVVWQVRPPAPSLTWVVKGTFAIVPGGTCTIAGDQPLCSGEVHHDDEPSHGVRLDSDFAILKPRAEWLLAGTCHVPGNQPLPRTAVSASVGAMTKTLAVHGDRHWTALRRTASEPEPFRAMTLGWRRSFGAPSSDANPLGIGMVDVAGADGVARRPLPNIEDPRELIVAADQRPRPAGAFPIPCGWKRRARKSGTPDAAWLEKRWPYYPEDFDWAYFNAAPADQQSNDYWRGDERIELVHLSPAHPRIETRLPGLRARCFLDLQGRKRSGFHEIPLRLDTITIDADVLQVVCLWRGITEVETESLDEVRRVLVTHEPIGKRMAPAHYQARLEQKLSERDAEEQSLEGEEPPETPSMPDLLPMVTSAGMKALEVSTPEIVAVPEPIAADPSKPPPRPLGTPELAETGEAIDLPALPPTAQIARQTRLSTLGTTRLSMFASTRVDAHPSPLRRYVEATLAQGASLAGALLANADLSMLDLEGVDLTGAVLRAANLAGTRLVGAKLDAATLAGADLTGAILTRASLVAADLYEVSAEACELADAILDDADLRKAQLRGAQMARASCLGTLFEDADLSLADLQEAKLDKAELRGAKLEHALLARASLIDATLHGVSASHVNMDDCNLTSLRASDGARFSAGSFRRVTGPRSRWEGADLNDADFSFSNLQKADFAKASLGRANLSGCNLRLALFHRAKLPLASILRSDLFEANLEEADLSQSDFRGSSLFGAQLWRARAPGARFDLANLDRTLLAGIVPRVAP